MDSDCCLPKSATAISMIPVYDELFIRGEVTMQIENSQIQNYRWTKGNLCPQHLSIPSYSFKYRKNVALKNGTVLHIRPVRGTDTPGLGRFYARLSEKSVFFRFGSRRINMPHDCLVRLCQLDFDRDFAFLAVVPGEKELMIGEVRLNRLAEFENAELSFIVADQWQGKGVGRLLMDFCLVVAKEIGLTALLMEVMKSNVPMIQFGYDYDFQRLPCNTEDDMETFELKIGSEAELFHPVRPYSPIKRQNTGLISGVREKQQTYH